MKFHWISLNQLLNELSLNEPWLYWGSLVPRPSVSFSDSLSGTHDSRRRVWWLYQPCTQTGLALASYPGSWWAERKRAWYLLFAHARNYALMNTCSGKSGRGTRNTYHVIGSVTYSSKYTSIVRAAKSETTTLQLVLHQPYSLQVLANLQSVTNSNTEVSYRLTRQ